MDGSNFLTMNKLTDVLFSLQDLEPLKEVVARGLKLHPRNAKFLILRHYTDQNQT